MTRDVGATGMNGMEVDRPRHGGGTDNNPPGGIRIVTGGPEDGNIGNTMTGITDQVGIGIIDLGAEEIGMDQMVATARMVAMFHMGQAVAVVAMARIILEAEVAALDHILAEVAAQAEAVAEATTTVAKRPIPSYLRVVK